MLGISLLRVLSQDCEVIGTTREVGSSDRLTIDLEQKAATVESIVGAAPSVVIHAAALSNVDLCETDQILARRLNVDATANIVEACRRSRSKLVFISTDYVFDGEKGSYAESDRVKPVNFYGSTKAEAERITAALSDSLIVRTSVLYGWHPSKLSFVTWVLKGLGQHEPLKVVNDHYNSPTFTDSLSRAIRVAIDREMKGVLHIAGAERVSRFEFARKIAGGFGLDETLLIPVEMRELGWVAQRPHDSSLDVGKAEKELGIELLGVDRGLEEMLRTQP